MIIKIYSLFLILFYLLYIGLPVLFYKFNLAPVRIFMTRILIFVTKITIILFIIFMFQTLKLWSILFVVVLFVLSPLLSIPLLLICGIFLFHIKIIFLILIIFTILPISHFQRIQITQNSIKIYKE